MQLLVILFVAILSLSSAWARDVQLEFSGRKISADLIDEMRHLPLADAMAYLQKKGIRILWINEAGKLSEKAIGEPEKQLIEAHVAASTEPAISTTLEKGEYLSTEVNVTENTIVLRESSRPRISTSSLIHGALHVSLSKHEIRLMINDNPFPGVQRLKRDIFELKKEVSIKFPSFDLRKLTLKGIEANPKAWEMTMNATYLNDMATLASILEELDIHFLIYQEKLSDTPVDELVKMSRQFNTRIASISNNVSAIRAIRKGGVTLSKEASEYMDKDMEVFRASEAQIGPYLESVRRIADQADRKIWEEFPDTIQLVRMNAASKPKQ